MRKVDLIPIPLIASLIAGVLVLFTAASCAGRKEEPPPVPMNATRPATGERRTVASSENDPNSVPDIARREVIRRQERLRQMDEAALRASQHMAEGNLEGAVDDYGRAINARPGQ